jgi:hypothetical protein
MSITRPIVWRQLIRFGVLVLILSAAIYLLYPKGVLELYGRDIPPAWSSDLGEMSFKEINERIGPPQDDVSAKGYQNWLENHWWGFKMLKVISNDCCKPTARPDTVVYIVYVHGWYDPVYREIISKSGHKTEKPEISGHFQTPSATLFDARSR